MATERKEVAGLVGSLVVVDTRSPFLYVGLLKEWGDHFVTLADVDVHDVSEGRSGKELYILETRRNGIQKNRREVLIRKDVVLSLSRVEDVLAY